MSIYEDRERVAKQIAGIERERDDNLKRLKSRLVESRKNGGSRQAIQELEEAIDREEGFTAALIRNSKEELARLDGQIQAREETAQLKAKAEMADQKSRAKASWISNGGEEPAFEQAWPEMEQEILKRQILRELDPASQTPKDRSGYGI